MHMKIPVKCTSSSQSFAIRCCFEHVWRENHTSPQPEQRMLVCFKKKPSKFAHRKLMASLVMEYMTRSEVFVGSAVKKNSLKAALDMGRKRKEILTMKAFRVDDGLINSRGKEKGQLTHFQKELRHFTIQT
ncbi:UNVERIFIED_CONTAM: hypothetical protein K2H54_026222 [Gekko kuhli]